MTAQIQATTTYYLLETENYIKDSFILSIMAITQFRSKRKSSGGRYQTFRKKRQSDRGNQPTFTKLGETKSKTIKSRGSSSKLKLLYSNKANVLDKKANKYVSSKIKSIVENPANRNYARRNIITKGTVIETEKGKAKVTSRPGQDGHVDAVLIE